MDNARTFGELVERTPVYDYIVEKYGFKAALIYGRIWRRCQGDKGICYESIPNMAKAMRLSHNTVRKYIAMFCDAGELFIEERPGKSNVYRITPVDALPLPNEVGVPLPNGGDEDTIKDTKRLRGRESYESEDLEEVTIISDVVVDSERESQKTSLIKGCKELGIRKQAVEQLTMKFGIDKPKEYLEWVQWENKRGKRYGAGLFIRAVNEGWTLPRDFKPSTYVYDYTKWAD